MNSIVRDGGIKSRKLWFSVFAIVALFGGGVMATLWPAFAPLYGELVGGVVGIAGLYLVGNVGQKWVGIKAPPEPPPARFPEEE